MPNVNVLKKELFAKIGREFSKSFMSCNPLHSWRGIRKPLFRVWSGSRVWNWSRDGNEPSWWRWDCHRHFKGDGLQDRSCGQQVRSTLRRRNRCSVQMLLGSRQAASLLNQEQGQETDADPSEARSSRGETICRGVCDPKHQIRYCYIQLFHWLARQATLKHLQT